MKTEMQEHINEIIAELEQGTMDIKAIRRLALKWNVPEGDVHYLLDKAMDTVIARKKQITNYGIKS
jgi:hypothetical protein